MPSQNQESIFYEDILRELYKNKVRYLVVGGVAVNLYGYHRFTKDMDLMLALDATNVKKFAQVIKKLGYRPLVPVSVESLANAKNRNQWIKEKGALVFHLLHSTKHFERIDVFLKNPISFERAYKKRTPLKIRNFEVELISLEDLIYLKKEANRPDDQRDVLALRNLNYRKEKE